MNPTYRDNGNISIGYLILMLNPPHIKLLTGGENPILDTRGGCFLMKPNFHQPTIKIDYCIDENTTRAFAINDASIERLAIFSEESLCTAVFCNRQRCIEVTRSGKVCECFSMQN